VASEAVCKLSLRLSAMTLRLLRLCAGNFELNVMLPVIASNLLESSGCCRR